MFKAALDNEMIRKHPMDGVRFSKPIKAKNSIQFLTVEEQKQFLDVAASSHNFYQYALVLETGLRAGELIGLTWDAIDFKNRTLTVNKTLEFRYSTQTWRAGPPKTRHSYRTIPLTNRAISLLRAVEAARPFRREAKMLDQTLEYLDTKSGKTKKLVMRDLVFINWRTGEPTKNSSYNTHLYKLCDDAGMKHFCMHALRHTYATRTIESGVQPKVLQQLLGHASIQTTMDTYVHVTDESMSQAITSFESHPGLSAGQIGPVEEIGPVNDIKNDFELKNWPRIGPVSKISKAANH